MAATGPPRRRRQPQRRCIACRRARSKRELVRIVRTPAGAVELDPTGKRSGRGAYLCHEEGCWQAGLRGDALEHHLHLPGRLPAEERERLLRERTAALDTALTREGP